MALNKLYKPTIVLGNIHSVPTTCSSFARVVAPLNRKLSQDQLIQYEQPTEDKILALQAPKKESDYPAIAIPSAINTYIYSR